MKNVLIVLGVLILIGGGVWLYSNRDSGETAVTTNPEEEVSGRVVFNTVPTVSEKEMETGTYNADAEESSIEWEAGKPAIAGYVHHGTFSLQSGTVTLEGQELTGEFVVDINSLEVTSLGGGKAGQESTLEGHLKGERFFDAENYSTATFTITDVSPKVMPSPEQSDYTATGNLTLKGKTEEVRFPMKVVVGDNNEVWVKASVDLDRTKWGISFGSASIAEEITDNIIGDTVNLDLTIKLTK